MPQTIDLRTPEVAWEFGIGDPSRQRELRANLDRSGGEQDRPVELVRQIIDRVRSGGDEALFEMIEAHDQVRVEELRIPSTAAEQALRDLHPLMREALEQMYDAVLSFHRATKPEDIRYERDGVVVDHVWRPVERAGCYVPGGRRQYPSSVLMSAVPARVAGVDKVVLCVPPPADIDSIQDVLAAAALAHVDEIYQVGGAHAIAALAYGTESIDPVDVIVGPGNLFVATAKQEVSGIVGVPSSFAGPSEVVVIADETSPADQVAIDLLVQAEHGPNSQVWFVTWNADYAIRVSQELEILLAEEWSRGLSDVMANGGRFVLVADRAAAVEVANAIAPQHLQLMCNAAGEMSHAIKHAGVVFVGAQTSPSAGDYMAGPSDVLPVHGSARYGSALGVRDFLRNQHIVSFDSSAVARVAPHVAAVAGAENLTAHALSAQMRVGR